jgi:hypothetical protein
MFAKVAGILQQAASGERDLNRLKSSAFEKAEYRRLRRPRAERTRAARPYITGSRPTCHLEVIGRQQTQELSPLGTSTGVITENCLPNAIKS